MAASQTSSRIQLQERLTFKASPDDTGPVEVLTRDTVEEPPSPAPQPALLDETSAMAWRSVVGAFLFLFPSYGKLCPSAMGFHNTEYI